MGQAKLLEPAGLIYTPLEPTSRVLSSALQLEAQAPVINSSYLASFLLAASSKLVLYGGLCRLHTSSYPYAHYGILEEKTVRTISYT